MVYDVTTPVGVFLEAAGARQPAPGGGAATALTGALAASMAEMVLNYSVNKKGLEHFQSELKPALEAVKGYRKEFEQFMVEDQAAYSTVAALRKLPADSAERLEKWAPAVDAAIRVPQSMLTCSVSLLEVCDNIINFVNTMLLSDLAVATDLAMATARCEIYNVRVNLPDLPDATSRNLAEVVINEQLLRASKIIQHASPRIWERVRQSY